MQLTKLKRRKRIHSRVRKSISGTPEQPGRNRRDGGRGRKGDNASSEPELREKMVALNRVSKVTKGGRTFTFAAIMVVGDGKGNRSPMEVAKQRGISMEKLFEG